jgi:glucosamine--fructose-6-phosphate aminotransferase (isomerizing)
MFMERGTYTREEIHSQPEAWQAALQVLDAQHKDVEALAKGGYDQVIFTGCGSTYYLALAAAALYQGLTGQPARGLPASELWLYPQSSYAGWTLLVAVSRSGETSETLRACEAFLADRRGSLLTYSCYGDKPLAKMGAVNVVLASGQERSIAQTRAFSTLYLATVALAAGSAGRDDLNGALRGLPEAGRKVLDQAAALAGGIGADESIDRFYWLGSGGRYGLACEVSLKMKEMSLSHSEPFHFMEFRHGPKSMVAKSAQVIGLLSTSNAKYESAVLADMESLGGRILSIGADQATIRIDSRLDEAIRNVLYLPVGQLIAFERSLSKGLNPDLPHNLDAVVKL